MDFMQTLKILLNEVCDFLDKEILQKNTLSEDVKSKAMTLRTRVINVSNQSVIPSLDRPSYTSMDKNGYVGPDAHLPPDDDYCTPVEPYDKDPKKTTTTFVCPYQNSLLSELQPVKSDLLYKKETFLYFPVNRPYFCVLLDDWLLFFNSNKKNYAQEAHLLKDVSAVSVDEKGTFELSINNKTYTMIADSRREKLQWVSAITDINNFKTTLDRFSINVSDNKSKHDSVESNVYEAIHERQVNHVSPKRDLPEIPRSPRISSAPRFMSPEYQNDGPNLQVLSSAQPRVSTGIHGIPAYLPPPCDDDEIYQFVTVTDDSRAVSLQPSLPATTSPSMNLQVQQAQGEPPGSDDIYQFAPAGNAPESEYNYCGNLNETEDNDDENIYTSIEEPLTQSPNRGYSRAPPTPEKPRNIPPPPKETAMLHELKLKHKLTQQHQAKIIPAGKRAVMLPDK